MKNRLFLGSFDSESFWRDKNLAKLPAIPDKERSIIVMAMDELLFPFCKENDVLITRHRISGAFKAYLNAIGFNFVCNERDIDKYSECDKASKDRCIFDALSHSDKKAYFRGLIKSGMEFSPYAYLPAAPSMCGQYNITYSGPDADAVIKVNSKIYSNELIDRIGLKNWGRIVATSSELEEVGKEYLNSSPFLVKDAFGVSGKGNMLINSESMLQRIVSYIAGQEKNGRVVQFLLEPFLDKQDDFSCEFHIDKSGKMEFVCVQKMINTDFAYNGSCTADEEFVSCLDSKGYFSCMENIAKELYKDGYFGDVCVDSMLLKNGDLVPIVEINARKSMGLINHYIDKYLSSFKVQGNLTHLSVGYSNTLEFDELKERMDKEGLLFKPESGKGIMPLSANALFISRELDVKFDPKKVYKGRFYASAAGKTLEERNALIENLRDFLTSLSFKIYN